jgi:hypothetical protein
LNREEKVVLVKNKKKKKKKSKEAAKVKVSFGLAIISVVCDIN